MRSSKSLQPTRRPLPLATLLLLCTACAPGSGERRQNPCASDTDCTLPERCGEDGLCALPEPLAAGEPCLHDAHCQSETCRDLGQGGVCMIPCSDAGYCSAEQRCLPLAAQALTAEAAQELQLLCAPQGPGEGFLGEACGEDAACRSGLCHQGRCATPCGSCPTGFSCTEESLSRADLSLAAPLCTPAPRLLIQELGAVATPAAGAEPLSFTVDPAEGPFVLTAYDADDLWVVVRRLTAPDGTVLLDLEQPEQAVLRAFPYHGVATLLVPGSDAPAAQLQAGSYSLLLGTYDPEQARQGELVALDGELEQVALVRRSLPGAGGLLDLTLHFAPATGLSAAAAAEDSYLRQTLDRLDTLLRSRAGVALGEIRYQDLTAAEDGTISGDGARQICRSYSQGDATRTSVDLFWVSALDFVDGGFAGAIPGPAGLYGTSASGILVEKYADYRIMAPLLAHELGHYLGLWHTTDLGGRTDQISDTPACAAGTNVESCPDRQNLMFPLFVANGALKLSPAQAQILRGNPLLYQERYPDVCGPGVAAIDLTDAGFASGSLEAEGGGITAASCGGSGPEQVHLLRLRQSPQELELRAQGHGFAPVLHLRHRACSESAAEMACSAAGEDELALVTLESPPAGDYYVFVDSEGGGARYELSLRLSD